MHTKVPPLALGLLALALAAPSAASAASVLDRNPGRLAMTLSLGGGLEAGTTSNGLGEFELTVGYEFRDFRPEVGIVYGLAPGDYAALRPGVHVPIARLPAYGRAALDFSNEREDWKVRWVLLGAGTEARLTSEMGAFAEADVGLPMASDFGLALLVRAGFSLRF